MQEKQTILKAVSVKSSREREKNDKIFAFDFSYWSFDGFKAEPSGYLSPIDVSNYCDQKRVFVTVYLLNEIKRTKPWPCHDVHETE